MEDKQFTLEDIIMKLVGNIDPVGESHIDGTRLDNLKEMCDLTHKLLDRIAYVTRNKDRYEHSMKKAGEYADKFLKEELKEYLQDEL